MYSVVLMMAMTAAPETPNWGHWRHGCWSCYGCYGCYGSCYGCWGYSSCYGWGSCYGCGGWASCYGCCGGYAYSCYGCCGGYAIPYSCIGYGIYGGASYTWPTPYYTSGPSTYGYGTPISYGAGTPVTPGTPAPAPKEEKLDNPKKTSISPDQARVIIRLPADAKLFANDVATTLSSEERWFTTPSLEKGRDFQYTMKIEYVRGGKTIADSQLVKVRAGETSRVEFTEKSVASVTPTENSDTAVSIIKVIAPPNAKLFVENRQELPAGAKEFKTPQLTKGREYAYMFHAELSKDGKKQAQSQRVIFKAGDPVTVDFSEMDSPRTASSK